MANVGLLAGAQPPKPASMFSTTPVKTANQISLAGNPTDSFSASLNQQDLARREVFDPQYQQALNYATDTSQPETQALLAGQQADKANQTTRDEFARLQSANGSAVDPRVTADTQRLALFDAAKNTAGAENNARQGTIDSQMSTLGGLSDYGVNAARQALGLSTGASSAYTARQQQLAQLKQAQASMNASATQADIGLGVSAAVAIAAIA
jgi:hypothetical protein